MKQIRTIARSDKEPTVDEVFRRIKTIAEGHYKPHMSKTCWNVVGVWLHDHPDVEFSRILFFGEHDPQYVNHVVLFDKYDRLLVDPLGTMGAVSADKKTYTDKRTRDTLPLIEIRKLER